DLVAEYAGVPLHEGSAAVSGYISEVDTELVKRHKAAGLITLGKTNTPEFGCLPTTEPSLFGPTINPWNPEIIPGGSSGGSAVAVATGIVPLAHGNDGGGSIRIPASCNGIFGLKPTRARNPLGPHIGDVGNGIAVEHGLSRTVRDSAALLDATSGPAIGDPYWAPPKKRPYIEEVGREVGNLKIGYITSIPFGWSFETKIDPECETAIRETAQFCGELGHKVEEIDVNELSYKNLFMHFGVIFSSTTGHMINYWERELDKKITQDEVEPVTWMVYQNAATRTGADYLTAVEHCQRFSRKLARWFHRGDYDILLNSTLTVPPIKPGSLSPNNIRKAGKAIQLMSKLVAYTFIYNISGQPAMSVPLYWTSDNVPIGMQFAARFGEEGLLFQLAAQLEKEKPWINRKPPIYYSC
ncbi:MAG: amidase, partial [Candidatus Lokiarchaeota archaeon]|nr:amidase [Candidatus Lokiarchaeota archaeon]MBD3339197.1 amidase [Candidatus Lokiarchaeota archaeon]